MSESLMSGKPEKLDLKDSLNRLMTASPEELAELREDIQDQLNRVKNILANIDRLMDLQGGREKKASVGSYKSKHEALPDAVKKEIYRRYEAGATPVDIARDLNLDGRRVSGLLLGLKNRKETA